ncbi:GNAT family N-acetyltransferase [Sphingomicrobium clamense]|uniref:GNAT family N-acetyltransferase n=1 Tax=Sphingomicrobium clamense TaxID=2851013 RepID=A0ABS6V2R2_9SPHN|nr:GNAT family N-acetyltransferase [Sphingomicrobium sp. B8]MBW0143849.1 GNAT family N-acetyltransferase [Sphingomicrobium sp. B8]
MADPDPELLAKIAPGVSSVDAAAWDALTSDPLTSHAFLSLLESSGSVGEGTGWSPTPILIEQADQQTDAVPAYLKSHSQGEYIFDHSWADAFERAGGRYYPKLLVAVPFTPCPGPRLLGPDKNAMLAAIEAVTSQNGLSSAHINFIEGDDLEAAEARGWLIRDGLQFHWRNDGYDSFDDFLAACSSRKRKTMRRERAQAAEGLEIATLRGAQIDAEAVEAMWGFYQDTGSRKWGMPYLTRAFFDGMVEALGDRLLLFLARRDGTPIAGALNIVGEDTLYGRYWGCNEDVPFLHFELSYYRAIDFAIEHGLSTVQAGAQGEHKVARGYRPVITKSAHFIPDTGFREAVAKYLVGERQAVAAEAAWFESKLPFKR